MSIDFSSIHNHHERAVFDAVHAAVPRFPGVHDDAELLADVACVALNRLAPRYIRHRVDYLFYLTERERAEHDKTISAAVDYAFEFVQARALMHARG